MKPPYQITSFILSKVASISEKIGEVKTAYLMQPPTELRKRNRIKTIQASLDIEGNTLTVEQITAIIDNKRVLAPEKDILEVKNAIVVYEKIKKYKPYSFKSLGDAHKLLMQGLVENAGKIRTKGVGIVKGKEVAHVAPPAHLVEGQLKELLDYTKNDEDLFLIKSCVFHYEFEFIHPFTDGNGRMGRLWQTVLLRQQYPVFDYLPIEILIKHKQKEYYDTLSKCDKLGNSTLFIEFMLTIIEQALEDLLSSQPIHIKAENRIELFKSIVGDKEFSRKNYMRHFKDISTATATRDLREATEKDILIKTGDGRITIYRYK
ncbi:Adenosine monophosphate-protein transferase SoFic [termite gut metagenome]|uniref:Adenosine monophosphate-protein transferase SoFic n=1 Tax=termite gut metagenome TaxID=433724 RepID=A0A5J4REH1_9ZZZZ